MKARNRLRMTAKARAEFRRKYREVCARAWGGKTQTLAELGNAAAAPETRT